MIDNITVSVLNRGDYSVPVRSNLEQITGNITTYQHSITAMGGSESCTITLDVDPVNASDYLDYFLRHIRVYDQYAQQIWSGIITKIDVDYGSAVTSIGIDNFASRYAFFNSNAQTPSATLYDDNVAKQYCDKYMPIQAKAAVGGAVLQAAFLTTQLNMFGAPNVQTRTNAQTKSSQQCQVTISAVGYYQTLSWVTVTASTAGTAADSSNFIISMLNGALTNNNYFGIGSMSTTGIVIGTTARWDAYTTYQQIIEDVLNAGTSTGQVLAWGVQPHNDLFELQVSAINNRTIDYVKTLGSAKIYTTGGAEVPPTQVVPNRNLSVQDFTPLYQPYGLTSIPGFQFINRISLQIDRNGYQLVLDPAGLWDATYELARMIKQKKYRFTVS